MIILAISAVVGVELGLRFKVFALIYGTVILVAIVVYNALATGAGTPFSVLWGTLAVLALQMGYLAGAVLSIGARS